MLNHFLSIAILAFLCAFSLSTLTAQEKTEEHKIVIIEKEVDENGKVTEKKVVKEGAEAKAYMEKMKKEGENSWTTEDGEVISLKGKKAKMIKKEAYEVKVEDENGQVKVLSWDGEGEMPAELKKIMEEEGLMDSMDEGQKKSRIRIKKNEGTDEKLMEFDFEGDELPEDVAEILQKEGIELEQIENEDGTIELRVKTVGEKGNTAKEKAQLGVNIEAHDKGVKVADVRPESAASEAGLEAGDIITEIDGETMGEVPVLIGKVSEYKPGDTISVTFLRQGQEMTKEVTLKARKELFQFKTWDEVMSHGQEKTIEIEIEKEVIKENKN